MKKRIRKLSTVGTGPIQNGRRVKQKNRKRPSQIPHSTFQSLAEYVAPHLTSIFTTSLETGKILHQWKTALVAPIFKNGEGNNAANYRPVIPMSICSKACEHIISKSIMQHLEDYALLTDSQHGYRSKHSHETQLLTLVDELLQGGARRK